jgi:ribosomal protein S27AE
MAQEKHYEMQWDCKFCGQTKLLGKTHRFCPVCGAAQDPDSRYFPADDEKVAVEDHVLVGEDKTCPSCGGLSAGDAVHCGTCGAPLEGAAAARTLDTQSIAAGKSFESSDSRDIDQERFEREMAAAGINPSGQEKKGGGGRTVGIIALVAVLLIGGLFFLFSRTTQATVLATGHSWEREIAIETYQTLRGEDWQNEVPAAAYNERCQLRQRDTRRVEDGETCERVRRDNGDGTFTEIEECEPRFREEPVMDDFCTYDIDGWAEGRIVRTSGEGLSPAPKWGEANLNTCSSDRLGCEREADRTERYVVQFRDEAGETYTCPYPLDEWQNIAIESRWSLEVRQFTSGAACNSLQPAG